jgi:hypothetical protein
MKNALVESFVYGGFYFTITRVINMDLGMGQ